MRNECTSLNNSFIRFSGINLVKYGSIFITFLLLSPIVSFQPTQAEHVESASYIIEFTFPALLQSISDQSGTLVSNDYFLSNRSFPKIKQMLTNISLFQKEAIAQILTVTDQEFTDQDMKQYQFLFNGVWFDHLSISAIKKIEQFSFVKRIEKDTSISISNQQFQSTSNPTILTDQKIESTDVINDLSTNSGKNISIAFFDTGIDYNHPALSNVYQGGYDFVNDDLDPYDDQGHGTHVIGISSGQKTLDSTQQVKGIAPNASVYAFKVLDENGEGYTSWFLSAFERAMDPNQDGNLSDHFDIISISAGNPDGSISDMLSTAATQAVNAGISVIAAAGNKGPSMNTMSSPAIAEQVIAVGASIQHTRIAPYSSRGALARSTIKPDVIAPGHQITSTWPNDQYQTLSGTSMATPYVTGIVACLLEQNPLLTPVELQKILHNHAISLGYNATTEGYGLITTNQSFFLEPLKKVSIHSMQNINSEYMKINLSIPNIDTSINISITLFSAKQQFPHQILQINKQTETPYTAINLPIKQLNSGYYLLQINLTTQQFISRLKQHIFIENDNQSLISYPHTISESTEFSCSINDYSLSTTPFFIFYVPLRTLQIKRGNTVTFTTPQIFSNQKETRTAVLLTIIPEIPLRIEKHSIHVVNTDP